MSDYNTTDIDYLIEQLRGARDKAEITPEVMGFIIRQVADAVAANGSVLADMKAAIAYSTGSVPALVGRPSISCRVREGRLYLEGYEHYVAAGLVPMLFRRTRKRNPNHAWELSGATSGPKYCPKNKGFHAYGKSDSLSLGSDGLVAFSENKHHLLSQGTEVWSPDVSALVKEYRREDGKAFVPWGRTMVPVVDSDNNPRMLRFEWYIGFVRPKVAASRRFTLADVASNLAVFSVVGMPCLAKRVPVSGDVLNWCFSK